MPTPHAGRQLVYAKKLHAHYLVARSHPSPERLRARLDETVGDTMRRMLTSLLAQHISSTDDAIWLIRRLDVVMSMNAAWDPDQIARVWAQQIALALVQILNAGVDGTNAIRFGNRAEYVSHFLGDLVAGTAWSRWYYKEFEGVRLLTQSSAIRTVVTRDPVVGTDALLMLPSAALTQVIASLSIQDARQLLAVIPNGENVVSERECLEVAWRMYKTMHGDVGPGSEVHQTLRLVLEVLRLHPEWTGETLVAATRAIVALIRIAATTPETLPAIQRVLVSGRAIAWQLYMIVSLEDVGLLVPLASSHPAWLDRVIRVLTHADGRAKRRLGEEEPEIRATPFGGAFLLLPSIAALPFERATDGWLGCDETSAASLTRFLILAKCLGGSSLPRLMLDPVMRDLLGVDPKLGIGAISAWLAALTPAQLAQFQEVLIAFGALPIAAVSRSDEADSVSASSVVTYEFAAARRDARYLSFPTGIRESSAVRRTLGRIAARVLRDLSGRLPGFSRASFPHLHANFLSINATLEEQENRRVVRLSRPPFDIILNMTGMSRATYRLSWLDDKPFVLFPESAR